VFKVYERVRGPEGTNTTPDFSLFDGSACVNSGVLKNGDTYTVVFPSTGNFKLVCLAHPDMTATIHVLALSDPLPHDQAFYDEQADRQRAALLAAAHASEHTHNEDGSVALGGGKILGTGGGTQTASVMRFMEARKVIHAGDTVEWTTAEAVTNHTVTFGTEPADLTKPFGAVTIDSDGALHASISSPSDNVHSGFITQAPQDRINFAQVPLGVTRFRVTFTTPGVYNYKCSLHDGLGMLGQVIVLP
jgi:plastocyanin